MTEIYIYIYIYIYEHEAIRRPKSENNIGAPSAPQKCPPDNQLIRGYPLSSNEYNLCICEGLTAVSRRQLSFPNGKIGNGNGNT